MAPKKAIPKKIKQLVWNSYIGERNGVGICQCCQTTEISQMNFQCGHIISEKNGGDIILSNLAPICSLCNSSMGATNMDVFIKKHGLKNNEKIFIKEDPIHNNEKNKTIKEEYTDNNKLVVYIMDCNICKKKYNSYNGLWKHKNKYHPETLKKNIDGFKCKNCDMIFNTKHKKYYHQNKICDKTIKQ
jgi:hypothetical protein